MHPIHDHLAIKEVTADHCEALKTVVAKESLAGNVRAMAGSVLVVGTVVLARNAGHGIEEVRISEEPPGKGEDRDIAQRRWQQGIEDPDEAHPCLLR